jgi:hypothetical protein
MIELINPRTGKPDRRLVAKVHPDWAHWMDASCYGREEARKLLGLRNGTFYRRITKEPSLLDRLAMAALWEGLSEWTEENYP